MATPVFLWLLLPALAVLIWRLSRYDTGSVALPGNWNRIIEPALQSFMSRSAISDTRPRFALLLGMWTLLVLALAQPGIENAGTPDYANIAGRAIVLDLGAQASIHRQRLAVTRLLDAAPAVPTAIVMATSESFEAVPLTVDRAHLERYLQVIEPDIMPVAGRALELAAAHGEGLLDRASIIAGQVVVISGGPPPPADTVMPPRWPRALIITDGDPADWSTYADKTGARLRDIDEVGAIVQDLDRDIARALRQSEQPARHELTPWLIAAGLLLWLALFRRRSGA
jgi:hypothetical protein